MSVEESNSERVFNVFADRCDNCNARASVEVVKGDLSLILCNHHYNKHEFVLMEQGWSLIVAAKVVEQTTAPATV